MAFSRAKQKFSKQEIIEILKKNVTLFKDEDEFVQYIVDLALFLVEHRLMTQNDLPKEARDKQKQADYPAGPIEGLVGPKRKDLRMTRERDEELYGVLKKYATRSDSPVCRMCGAETQGRAVCPMCGNMTF